MDLVIGKNESVSLKGDFRGQQLECLEGTIWLTQSGDGRDHILRPGGSFIVRTKGHIVLTARSGARLGLSRSVRILAGKYFKEF